MLVLTVPTELTFYFKYLLMLFSNWMSEQSEFHLAYKSCVYDLDNIVLTIVPNQRVTKVCVLYILIKIRIQPL